MRGRNATTEDGTRPRFITPSKSEDVRVARTCGRIRPQTWPRKADWHDPSPAAPAGPAATGMAARVLYRAGGVALEATQCGPCLATQQAPLSLSLAHPPTVTHMHPMVPRPTGTALHGSRWPPHCGAAGTVAPWFEPRSTYPGRRRPRPRPHRNSSSSSHRPHRHSSGCPRNRRRTSTRRRRGRRLGRRRRSAPCHRSSGCPRNGSRRRQQRGTQSSRTCAKHGGRARRRETGMHWV